jgi:hypothetical protein
MLNMCEGNEFRPEGAKTKKGKKNMPPERAFTITD